MGVEMLGQKTNRPSLTMGNRQVTPNTNLGPNIGDNVALGLSKVGGFAMKHSNYLGAGADIGTASIASGNTINNNQFGTFDDSQTGLRATVTNNFPLAGAVNSIMSMGGAALNTGNRYDKYGYNHREGYGRNYFRLGGNFDPIGMGMRSIKKGGEGSGLRAIQGFLGLGGISQYNYEQKEALKEKQRQLDAEQEEWKLNQFVYTPNLDV